MEHKHDSKKSKGYEDRDANARGVAITGLALGVLILGSLWLAYGAIIFLSARAKNQDRKLPPMFQTQVEVPEPRLQVTPVKDLKTIRAEEEKVLTTYDWVDPRAQIVRIPETRALELILQRGLPFRPKAAPSAGEESA